MYNPVQQFFFCVANRDISGVLETVTDNAVFEAQGPETVPIYGRFEGKQGVEKFVNTLFELFDTEAFEIYQWAFADDFVFAYGYLRHRVRQTGKVFKSEWSLVCRLKGDRISAYKMFEDTDALRSAYTQQ